MKDKSTDGINGQNAAEIHLRYSFIDQAKIERTEVTLGFAAVELYCGVISGYIFFALTLGS